MPIYGIASTSSTESLFFSFSTTIECAAYFYAIFLCCIFPLPFNFFFSIAIAFAEHWITTEWGLNLIKYFFFHQFNF